MSKTFDVLMKILEQKGSIPDEDAVKAIKDNGPLSEDEKKQVAAAIKMKKALTKSDDKKDDKDKDKDKDKKDDKADKTAEKEKKADDIAFDDYLQALSVLDSDAGKEDKEKAQKVKDKFESQ